MSRTLRISPAGHLFIESDDEAKPDLNDALCEDLERAFAASTPAGLVWLCAQSAGTALPPVLLFWREFAQRLVHELCNLGEEADKKWTRPDAPPEDELRSLLASAPPMRGLEYLTPALFRQVWNELFDHASQQARQHPGGQRAWLTEVHPLMQLLGRVTFHLAENKRDEHRPFAFLATYSHRVSKQARLQHLPLGQALKDYAGAKNRQRLTALLEPVQRAAGVSTLVRELLDTRALFQPQAWSIGQAYRFLKEVPVLESAGLVVRVPDWWRARRPPRPQVQVKLGKQQTSEFGLDSMLDFTTNLALDGETLTEAERDEILNATDGLLLLRGKWVEVDRERLQQTLDRWQQLEAEHADGIGFIDGMRLLAGAQLDAASDDDITADWSQVVADGSLRETLATIRNPSGISGINPGQELQATLRPYQEDGVRWLWFMNRLGLGACLADDMGLGKTIQVIDLLLQLRREGGSFNGKPEASTKKVAQGQASPNPSLLVVPASLIGNWKQELAKFAPSLRVFFAHRSQSDADELSRAAKSPQETLAGFDLVITTYGLVRREKWFSNRRWTLVVLDEAQAIKNASSAQTKAVKRLPASGRIVLTGTPVENHVGDLWSIFDFCCPGLLGSATQFKRYVQRLNKQQDAQAYGALRKLVTPYILRRLKTDPAIAPDLPDKTEMRTECGLSKKQATLYEKTVRDLARRLEEADGMARRGLVLSVLMQLKQICNHPSQFLAQAEYAANDSGKFRRLADVCGPIVERQEKVLVFTQFQSVCDPLAEFLATVFGRPGLVLTGKTSVRKRSELVKQFQADDGPPFFVISVKAGGSGLNLTAASHVVHFDRWWNPAVENQATDRAFRIGQKRNVLVHKFVCRGTVEERIDDMLREKQNVSDQILNQGGETMLTEMPDDELLNFVAIDLTRAADE